MNKRIKTLLIIGIVVFLVIAIISGWKVVSILKNYRDSERTYEDAAEEYTIWDEEAADAEPTPMTAEDFREAVENPRRPILAVDFASLQAENGDVFGWIYSKGSQINYPVVQGSDNVFYMDHLYNEEWNPGGAIFMDYRNQPDFSDYNTIIYGHNMLDGTMFASLGKYSAPGYYDTHRELQLLTRWPIPDLDLLVAGHHGADNATSSLLVQHTKPETAIISVGADNAFGHPSPQTLQRLHNAGAEILRTDELGTVTIPFQTGRDTDGKKRE